MTIHQTKNGEDLVLALEGRLDTNTAPELEKTIKDSLEGVMHLTMDMKDLAYISSAGLRVLLQGQKTMNGKGGSMKLTHVNSLVMEVLEVTGFTDILQIEA